MSDPAFLAIFRRALIMIIRRAEKQPADPFMVVLATALNDIVSYINIANDKIGA